jgi:mannose-1-phosphate guanylyltransferase
MQNYLYEIKKRVNSQKKLIDMNKNQYCVIMAGGVGSRFWPLSRKAKPKQFLDILGTGRTLIQQTFDRFKKIIPVENILIVSNEEYADLIAEQLPEIHANNILLEPMRRNTAPCIAYSNFKILKANPHANIIVAPSDHLILDETDFINKVTLGLEFVSKQKALLTLGIRPSRPETGYGYIQINPEKVDDHFNKVKTFTEKPDLKMAKLFVESGEFFWNSGIFIWSLPAILDAFNEHLPEIQSLFSEGVQFFNTPEEKPFIQSLYSRCKNISIDYGVMEKAKNVYVMCADFGWSDLGTWGSLYEHQHHDEKSNAITGAKVLTYDTANCIINMPNNKTVVVQGLDDYIVAESNNVLMICKKKDEQEIRTFVADVALQHGEDLV